MDRGAWRDTAHGLTQSQTRLNTQAQEKASRDADSPHSRRRQLQPGEHRGSTETQTTRVHRDASSSLGNTEAYCPVEADSSPTLASKDLSGPSLMTNTWHFEISFGPAY